MHGKSPPSPPVKTSLERWLSVLAPLAAGWTLLAAVEVALGLVVPGATLRDHDLSLAARLSLVAYDLALLAVVVCVVAGPFTLGTLLFRCRRRGLPRGVMTALQTVVLGIAVLLYGASWTMFWHTGVFLNREAIGFWATQPIQVFHWVYPPLAIGVLAAILLFTAALGIWLPMLLARADRAARSRLVLVAAASAGVCVVVAWFGELAYGRSGGDSGVPYVLTRNERTGPAVRALVDVLESVRPAQSPFATAAAASATKTRRRPIISMETYLAGVHQDRMKRWNVLMVQIESLRSDQLRVYGGSREVMPSLEALAAESRVFTNAYIQATHSNYADVVPLGSQYPLRSATEHVYPKDPTYPRVLIYEVLKAVGYRTAVFSSQNENWGGMINYHRLSSLDRFFNAANFDGPTYTPWEDVVFANWVKETKAAGSVDDRYTVDAAIQWIGGVGETPFFVHMNLQSSHLPYIVPDDFPHRFGPKHLDFTIMWGRFPRDKVEVVKDRYADSLFYADSQLARLFRYLKDRGLWERTVIVVGGDNGEGFYEHEFAGHANWAFNEVVKVPMLIHAPGLEPGQDVRPAMFLDVPPTILALLGLPPHPGFQGISLVEPQFNRDRSIYIVVHTPVTRQYTIVQSGFKLMFDDVQQMVYLYDLSKDPAEKLNVAPSHRDIVRRLNAHLATWYEEQIKYYSDVPRQRREYPPMFED